jgi:hypothetical protein
MGNPVRWGWFDDQGCDSRTTIFEWHDDDEYGGFMEYDELRKITADVLDLPDVEFAEEPYGFPLPMLKPT